MTWTPGEAAPTVTGYPSGYTDLSGRYTGGSYLTGTTVTTNYPAISGITTPTTPTTPTATQTAALPYRIISMLNKGWNSWARSINPLTVGNFYSCTVPSAEAAFFAISTIGKEGNHIGSFKHALIVDTSGVSVYEEGTAVLKLRTGYLPTSKIKIFRNTDNTVHYVVTTGTETKVHRSLQAVSESWIMPFYVYCYLYSGGDKVLDAEFKEGIVQYGAV